MLTAKCLYIDDYEWLLVKGRDYKVLSWTDDTIVIKDEKCGMFGLNRERFDFKVPYNFITEFDKIIGGNRYYPIND